jgi:putative flippase GtrA
MSSVKNQKLIFLAIGIVNATFNLAVFSILRILSADRVSNFTVLCMSTSFSVFFAFTTQRTFVWKHQGDYAAPLVRFLLTYGLFFMINIWIMNKLVDKGFLPIQSQFLALLIIGVVAYSVQKYWIFSR